MADSVMPAQPRASRSAAGRLRSAVTTMVRSVTVAAGVFAPGHLGELTRQVPFELVDAVLEQTRATEHRLRILPSRVGVYFVVALALFPGLGSTKVWAKLVAGLDAGARPSVSEKALRDLRRRVGAAPLKALFEVLAGPVAQPRTPGCGSAATARSPSTAASRSRHPIPVGTGPGWARCAPRTGSPDIRRSS